MLVQFTFGNFRSFRDRTTLSMIAASKLHSDPAVDPQNVFDAPERESLKLLRVAALYGANASGKSNVGLALQAFLACIGESANIGFRFTAEPFRLDTISREEPVFFEMTFLMNGALYRYGFEVRGNPEHHEITAEWLYRATSAVETLLFDRTGDQVRRGRRFPEGSALLEGGRLRRKEALYLSLAAQLGEQTPSALVNHLTWSVNVISGLEDEHLRTYTVSCLREDRYRKGILSLVREADTGIPKIGVMKEGKEIDFDFPGDIPEEVREQAREAARRALEVVALHPVFDEAGKQVGTVPFPMDVWESQGTRKLFAFAGPILDTLAGGETLFVDEMDARFHPLLTRALIRLFQSPESNPRNAQLVFVTHDTNLLDQQVFRRDQIYFVEKDRFGGSHLYSLADFKGVRKDSSFEADYIRGRYGAIPFLGGLRRLFGDGEPEASEGEEHTSNDDPRSALSLATTHAET